VIPPNPTRKHPYPWDRQAYSLRNVIEGIFRCLKDFRCIAIRSEKLARNSSPPSSSSPQSTEFRPYFGQCKTRAHPSVNRAFANIAQVRQANWPGTSVRNAAIWT